MRMVTTMAALLVFAVAVPTANAASKTRAPELREVGPDYNKGKALPLRGSLTPARAPSARTRARAAQVGTTPAIGTVKSWLALDDASDQIYVKQYTLRAAGDHVEVWVANDLQFPPGDCRNGARTTITDDQAQYLAGQFDDNMYPKESETFSVPPDRDGSEPLITSIGGEPVPPGYWGGQGDDIVTLVDNVRDDNYYDTNNASNFSYIAGFFYSVFNEFLDRNVMTIDAFDWLHRTGANPPNEPAPGDSCANAPARPFLYEGVFAHEYQHLLQHYEDPDEGNWVNEGLSDWAQSLTGYVDPSLPITEQGFDSHVQCFLGWLGVQTPANPIPRRGGPENSLTLWGDQGDGEILCDYGAAYSIMEMLAGRYDQGFMTALHRGDANGLAGLQEALTAVGSDNSAESVLHDWAAMVALDGVLDRGASLLGRQARALRTPGLDASINWDETNAYDTPGAPPNGSDYVRLRDGRGRFLGARQLRSLKFAGSDSLEPKPVEWTVDPNPEGRTGNPALFSGSGTNFDRSIVRQVTVPAENATLTFDTRWNTEGGWDFGFVQVSTDGGQTYTSLGNTDTTSVHDPGAIALVAANVPGFTGDSGGWKAETFDLAAYAGQTIQLAFRYVTDSSVDLPGWWIDNVAVGGAAITDGSSTAGWQTITQVRPVPVDGYSLQLVGYRSDTLERAVSARASRNGPRRGRHTGHGRRDVAFAYTVRLNGRHQALLDARALRALRARAPKADVIAALVMQDDPAELVDQYARYTLTANGVTQPGG
jgi:hypothetical protein